MDDTTVPDHFAGLEDSRVLEHLRKQQPEVQWAMYYFYAWGFNDAAPEDVRSLELGRAKEVAQARQGLGGHLDYPHGLVSGPDVNLLSFGIRVGVAPGKLTRWFITPTDSACRAIADRGPDYLRRYIVSALSSQFGEVFSPHLIAEMERLGEPVLARAGYLWQWAGVAQHQRLGLPDPVPGYFPTLDLSPATMRQYIHALCSIPIELDEDCISMLQFAEAEGAVSRDELVDLLFDGLQYAARPIERASWIRAMEVSGVSDEELRWRADQAIALMGLGHGPTTEFLGVRLAGVVDDDLLPELATSLTMGTTAKAATLVLQALGCRPRPSDDVRGTVVALLSEVATNTALAAAVATVVEAWGVTAQDGSAQDAPLPGERPAVPWPPVPEVWTVPRFVSGPATPEHLTELVGLLLRRSDPLDRARLEATMIAVLWRKPEAVAVVGAALQGGEAFDLYHSQEGRELVSDVRDRVRRGTLEGTFIASVPVALSTPSYDDMRITGSDLVERLERYADENIGVFGTDLERALTFLDPVTVTADVRMRLTDLFHRWTVTGAVEAVEAVLTCVEPSRADDQTPLIRMQGPPDGELDPWKGGWMLQVARHPIALSPGNAMNMLSALRAVDTRSHELSWEAVRAAWSRGLLRPGTPDLMQLDWQDTPAGFASLSRVLLEVAEQGMLPLAWPVLSDMVDYAATADRIPPGVADTVEVIGELLPSVLAAVRAGNAPDEVLALSGIWGLAARKSSAQAVTRAKKLVESLRAEGQGPVQDAPVPQPVGEGSGTTPWRFSEVWGDDLHSWPDDDAPALIDDGASVTVSRDIATGKSPVLHIRLPEHEGDVYECALDYSLWRASLGYLQLYREDTVTGQAVSIGPVSLRLAGETGARRILEPIPYDRDQRIEGPYCRTSILRSLATLAVADKSSLRLNGQYRGQVSDGTVTARDVRDSVRPILESDLGGRMVRGLEVVPESLPLLWPILTESVAYAAERARAGEPLPRWLSRVLDVCFLARPVLEEAERRGLVPEGTARFPGLEVLAATKGSSVGVKKARALLELV